jgi:hypothetical protein
LRDYHTGAEYKSYSNLTSDELLTIAGVAKSTYMLNRKPRDLSFSR